MLILNSMYMPEEKKTSAGKKNNFSLFEIRPDRGKAGEKEKSFFQIGKEMAKRDAKHRKKKK